MATARIQAEDHRLLVAIAKRRGLQHQQVLHEALELYDRHTFLEELNASFAELRADAAEWNHELAERAFWDSPLRDGLSGNRL